MVSGASPFFARSDAESTACVSTIGFSNPTVTTKNGTPRVLFFSEQTAQLLKRVYAKRIPEKLLFEGRVPGQPISFRRIWGVITKEVGLPDLHMHDVRHAAAASLLRAGVTLGVAAQVLGHDPALLARRYGHLETASLKLAQEAAWNRN